MSEHGAVKTLGMMLYGERWLDRMSTELSVNERTIRRWANGSQPIPRGVMEDIDGLIDSHFGDIIAVRSKLVSEQIKLAACGNINVDN